MFSNEAGMGSAPNASASADVTMEFMAIVNIVVILLLGGIAIKVLNHYEQQKREGKEPEFLEEEVGLQGTVWKK